VSNNIGEGRSSSRIQEFRQFLNVARRSLFEDASLLLVFQRMGLLRRDEASPLLVSADTLSGNLSSCVKGLR